MHLKRDGLPSSPGQSRSAAGNRGEHAIPNPNEWHANHVMLVTADEQNRTDRIRSEGLGALITGVMARRELPLMTSEVSVR